MVHYLPKTAFGTFLVILHCSSLYGQGGDPIRLSVTGNQSKRMVPGETINIYVSATGNGSGTLSLKIRPQQPPFALNWDAKTTTCLTSCTLTDTLTLKPDLEQCGTYSFAIAAQLTGPGGPFKFEHQMTVEVVPKIISEPPFTPGKSNEICWSGCEGILEELHFFPKASQQTTLLSPATLSSGLRTDCQILENLAAGTKYGFYLESTVLDSGRFVVLRSDTAFSTQDFLPPPSVSLQGFTTSSGGDVELRWPYLRDATGFIEKYVVYRRNVNSGIGPFGMVDTVHFFPATNVVPRKYYPVKADTSEALYLDRTEVITTLPDAVKGSTMIRTAMSDRWSEADDFITLRLLTPARVYIALDKKLKPGPDWLQRDYRTIRKDVVTSNGTNLVLFKSKEIMPAGELVLGGNFARGADISHKEPFMYSAFIQPIDDLFPYAQGDIISYTDPLGEENDLHTFNYRIDAIDAAGNLSEGSTSAPVILDLKGHCKPIIKDWFVFEDQAGDKFAKGSDNTICVSDPATQSECFGFRDTDSLRFEAVRGNVALFGAHRPEDEGVVFLDSGWLGVTDLEKLCYEFNLLPPGKDPNFVNAQEYFYRVRGKDVHGNLSVWSDTVSAVQDFFPPTDISNLGAETEIFQNGDDGCIELSWQPAVDHVSGVNAYLVYRSADGGASFTIVGSVDGRTTTFCDTLSKIQDNQVFNYKISPQDGVGNFHAIEDSQWEVSLRALVGPSIEVDLSQTTECPEGVLGVGRDTLTIQWQSFDVTGVVGFEARVLGPNGSSSKVVNDPGITKLDCPLTGGDGTYEIRVRALYGNSVVTIFSNPLTIRKKSSLQGVENLIAIQDPDPTGNIALSWTHPDREEILEFQIFSWPEGAEQPNQPTVVLPGDSLQWLHSYEANSLVAYQCNNYLVRARDCFGLVSSAETVVSQYAKPAPFLDRTKIEFSGNDITVCWDRPSPRVKDDDSFNAEVVVYQDSVGAKPFFTGTVFNKQCFTLLNADPMHNYIFKVREIILDDLEQSCAESFSSAFSDPLIVPLDNQPAAVVFVVQPLPVPPDDTVGNVFVSWQGFSDPSVEEFVVLWSSIEAGAVVDSVRIATADTVLIQGLDISKTYEFQVIAVDFLNQRSVNNQTKTASFKPKWVFTPRLQEMAPACFSDSVAIRWSWVDESITPVDGNFGADSVFVELSIDPRFKFNKTVTSLDLRKSYTFQRDRDYPFVTNQNRTLYVRIRAKDKFNHVSPWSSDYDELGILSGDFDDIPPGVVTTLVDSTKAPDFGEPGLVNVHLRWDDAPDNCSGTWFYEISRNDQVIARDTSRVRVHRFVDRGVLADDNFQNLEWQVNAVDSAGNRQGLATADRVTLMIQPPDSAGCADDSTFCWSASHTSVPGLAVKYIVEGTRFVELFGNPTTNIVSSPLAERCFNFDVPWEGVFWRVKARANEFESAWSATFFCQLSPEGEITSVERAGSTGLPGSFALRPNYPNPFNPTTTIEYAVPRSGGESVSVLIELFNVAGQKIRTLVEASHQPGEYSVVWDARDDFGRTVGSGVYVYQMRVKGFIAAHQLILLK